MNVAPEDKNPYSSPNSTERPLSNSADRPPPKPRRQTTALDTFAALPFVVVGTTALGFCLFLAFRRANLGIGFIRFDYTLKNIVMTGIAAAVCIYVAWLLGRGKLVKEAPPDPTRPHD